MHLENVPMPHVSDIPNGKGVLVKVRRVGVEALAERYAALAASTRSAIGVADPSDADTADLLTEVSRGLDKALWSLEAHLQE